MLGGGGMTGTATSSKTGTVSSTSGSATITGTGTTFLTDYKRGDQFEWQWNGTAWVSGTVASVASNTSLTLTANASNTTAVPRSHRSDTRQYSPAVLQLEGTYGYHGGGDGDYIYSLYPSGGNGQPRWMKSSSIEDTSIPTADNDGYAIVTGQHSDTTARNISASGTETTISTGYTIPAYTLQDGNTIRVKFFGDMTTLASTSTITWRVKLGGTTILTSNVQQSGSTNTIDFMGEVAITGTSNTAQVVALNINGKDTSTTAAPTYGVCEIGTGSRDMRIDRALTITADFSDASTMSVKHSSVVLEQ